MDPVGPWSAYASYNRLAGAAQGEPPTTTAQIIPGGFLSSVSYETAFSPLFHGAKPAAHYVTQHRALAKQDGEYQQPFFEQGGWQQNSPFGVLPHESVPATTAKAPGYENFNAHFAAAQTLNHLQLAKTPVTRAQSPATAPKVTQTFFQTTFADTNTTKSFANSNASCIVSSPTKEYRVPQAPRSYLSSSNPPPPRPLKQPPQTKAQTKIYPELGNQSERRSEENNQSSPISFSLNYSANKRPQQFQSANYRHYPEQEYQRPKTESFSNGPDCNVVVPRRPSPLQAHSQASPLGHAPSPGYPMYNSPMNAISSPQQTNHVTPPSPLDVTVARPASQTNSVAYPVITRANQNCWKGGAQTYVNQQYFEGGQVLSSCRGDPMSLVKNLSCEEVKAPVKRRKSTEKEGARQPPPAHTSASQNQQQNGAYFDFDRWNLPPPNSKFLTSQQMVPHPPPPLPYFPPFHLPPPEFPVEVASHYEQNQFPQQPQQQQPDEPKVVVPNIEEELNFLSTKGNSIVKPPPKEKQNDGGSGFMSSYLKFLQGERDSSPPPISRTNRKSTWTRKPIIEEKAESNGTTPSAPPPPPVVTRLSQGDPQDDPRYFPLPKERKRNSFDSDSDGLSSEEDFFVTNKKTDRKERKKRVPKAERKRPKKQKIKEEVIPRRELSKRAAKEKTNFQHLIKDDDIEEPPEFQDSDSDPAWTPQAKEDGEEIVPISKKIKKGGKKKRNLITAAAQGAGINEFDDYDARKNKNGKSKQNAPPTLEDNILASLPNLSQNEDNHFKPGEFVVIKSELNQTWPAIWRVDGKTLLQKYEPFEQNGFTFYRNISTYTSYTPENRKQYIPIPVRYKSQSQSETIVEFLRNELMVIDTDYQEKCMKECECYQDNFEVYIQTLISQALDSNFLTEIFQEKDEYFLSNVKTIDDITESKKRKLLLLLRWPPAVQAAVCTWPCFNVIREVNPSDVHTKTCAACGRQEVSVRVLMYGQPYNSTTLEGCQPDPKAMNEKNFLMCRICATRVELSNKVTHQKYLMYLECAKRVGEKRTNDPSKDTTCILNELLADENWLNQLFLQVRTSWAEIDCIEYSFRLKSSVYAQ